MPQLHIHIGGGSINNDLRRFRENLKAAGELAAYLRGVFDNMNDAVDFSVIEDEVGIAPQYAVNGTNQVRITDTNCNGYKLLAYVGDMDNVFKSNAGDGSQPQDKIKERVDKIVNYLA